MTAHVSLSEKIISLWAVTDEEHNILRCHEDDVLSIHRAIFSIYKDQERVTRWVRHPNRAIEGRSPLDLMLTGDIERVRAYALYHAYNGW